METTIDHTKPEFFTALLDQLTAALGVPTGREIPATVRAKINAASDAFSQIAPVIPKLALLAGCEKLELFINGQETDRRKLAALSMRLRIMAHLDRTFSKSVGTSTPPATSPPAASPASPAPPSTRKSPAKEVDALITANALIESHSSHANPPLSPLTPAQTLLAAGPPTSIESLTQFPLHSAHLPAPPATHRQSVCSYMLARAGSAMTDAFSPRNFTGLAPPLSRAPA